MNEDMKGRTSMIYKEGYSNLFTNQNELVYT